MNQEKKNNNADWFLIKAKDDSCRGYWPGKDERDACQKFGLDLEKCSVKRVIRTEEGFIEQDQCEQGKLL